MEVSYDFYKDYNNKDIEERIQKRIENIRTKYFIKNISNDFIEEYFVEIFSWSVPTKLVLDKIGRYISFYSLSGVVDPCCGNAFHTYLFKTYCGLDVHSVDIQDEKDSWLPITETDGRQFLKHLEPSEHRRMALLLSWVDYESLTNDLLDIYMGNLVISVGNYEHLSPNYITKIKKEFNLLEKMELVMPWGLTEKIEIYHRVI